MPQLIACPHCRQTVTSDSSNAGRIVACPACQGQFSMPPLTGELMAPQSHPSMVAPQQGPMGGWQPAPATSGPVFINAAPRTEKRLAASGWFTRAFGSTLGVVMAIFAVLATCVALICGGCLVIGGASTAVISDAAATVAKDQKNKTDTAKRFALPALKKHGIIALDEHAMFLDTFGERKLVGKGRQAGGKMVDVVVEFDIGKFGTTEQWQIQRIAIGQETVFERK